TKKHVVGIEVEGLEESDEEGEDGGEQDEVEDEDATGSRQERDSLPGANTTRCSPPRVAAIGHAKNNNRDNGILPLRYDYDDEEEYSDDDLDGEVVQVEDIGRRLSTVISIHDGHKEDGAVLDRGFD
ncbi:hypothetical protein HDU76_011955, partial [Blyttiomyces sp. JEL0837]